MLPTQTRPVNSRLSPGMERADLRYVRKHETDTEPACEKRGKGVVLLHSGVNRVCVRVEECVRRGIRPDWKVAWW